jgi:hypothetical protein
MPHLHRRSCRSGLSALLHQNLGPAAKPRRKAWAAYAAAGGVLSAMAILAVGAVAQAGVASQAPAGGSVAAQAGAPAAARITVVATAAPDTGLAPLRVQFGAKLEGEDAPRVTPPRAWQWDFGDGQSGTGQAPVHVYREAGYHTAKVTFTARDGQKYEGSVEVHVREPLAVVKITAAPNPAYAPAGKTTTVTYTLTFENPLRKDPAVWEWQISIWPRPANPIPTSIGTEKTTLTLPVDLGVGNYEVFATVEAGSHGPAVAAGMGTNVVKVKEGTPSPTPAPTKSAPPTPSPSPTRMS